jgi:hypothetical protein
MTHDRCNDLEAADAFDRSLAEDAVSEALGGVEIFDSRVPGVVAFERVDVQDWNAFATDLAAKVGHPVACIASADWSFDDRHDEEAVYVAFAIPSLPADYADDHRNLMSARTVPSI